MIIEPTPKQLELISAALSGKYRIILFGGAIRGSKTFGMILTYFIAKRKWPGMRAVYVRKDTPTIERNTYPTFNKFNSSTIVKDKRGDNVNPRVIFDNNSELIFFGENYDRDKELNRWRGLETNWFLIDEINELQIASLWKAVERRGTYSIPGGNNPHSLIIATCNPSRGPIKELFYDRWENGTLPPDWLYIPAKVTDNLPFLKENPDFLESVKSLPRYEYEVFVEGNWNVQLKQGGEFLKNFELDKHVKPVNIDLEGTLHISVDNNVLPYVAVSIWQLERDNEKWKAKKVHEIPAKDPDNTASKAGRKTVSWLKEIDFNNKIFMYGDPTNLNRNTINDDKKNFYDLFVEPFQQAGFGFEKRYFNKAPSVPATGDFINAILEGKIQNIDIVYHEQCKESISDNIETKQDRDGSILKKRETDPKTGSSYEKHGHFVDTDRYFLCKVFYDEFQKFRNRFANYSDKTVPSYENELLKGF
jgi:hypothetical protein